MSRVLRHMLAILVIAGLIAGPLTVPAVAASGNMAMTMSDMSDAMPCCPHKVPPAHDCQKCPFAAVCSPQVTLGLPANIFGVALIPTMTRLTMSPSDVFGDSLGYDPPPRPPRSLVAA